MTRGNFMILDTGSAIEVRESMGGKAYSIRGKFPYDKSDKFKKAEAAAKAVAFADRETELDAKGGEA